MTNDSGGPVLLLCQRYVLAASVCMHDECKANPRVIKPVAEAAVVEKACTECGHPCPSEWCCNGCEAQR